MTFDNFEKYVYSKKCLKQRHLPTLPPPPTRIPPSSKVEDIFAPKIKSHLATAVICNQELNMPIQQIE